MTNHTDNAALRALIADDAYAMTFQSVAQYRSALLAASPAPAAATTEAYLVPDYHEPLNGANPTYRRLTFDEDVAHELAEIGRSEVVELVRRAPIQPSKEAPSAQPAPMPVAPTGVMISIEELDAWKHWSDLHNAPIIRNAIDKHLAARARASAVIPLPAQQVAATEPSANVVSHDIAKLTCEAKEAIFGLTNTLRHATPDHAWCEEAERPHLDKAFKTIDALAALFVRHYRPITPAVPDPIVVFRMAMTDAGVQGEAL